MLPLIWVYPQAINRWDAKDQINLHDGSPLDRSGHVSYNILTLSIFTSCVCLGVGVLAGVRAGVAGGWAWVRVRVRVCCKDPRGCAAQPEHMLKWHQD